MACYLYKQTENGEIVREECFAEDVANLLDIGYKSSPESFIESNLDDAEDVPNDEVRQAAKDAGINNWNSARINTLRAKLGYDD